MIKKAVMDEFTETANAPEKRVITRSFLRLRDFLDARLKRHLRVPFIAAALKVIKNMARRKGLFCSLVRRP